WDTEYTVLEWSIEMHLQLLRRTVRGLRRHFIPPPPPSSVTLAEMFGGKPAVVIKVGANDGLQGDPIAELIRQNSIWDVLFIEPLPHIFRRLIENYQGSPQYRFENVAISWKRGARRMYYVSDGIKRIRPNVPIWYDQLGSFDRDHILKFGKEFAPFITSE